MGKILDDVKFWAPPLGAIAIAFFNVPSAPALRNHLVVLSVTGLAAVFVLNVFGPGKFTRALACGLAMALMKVHGSVVPPAGALAVLFVDNAKVQGLGYFYALMPGVTGTAVLALLAYIRL